MARNLEGGFLTLKFENHTHFIIRKKENITTCAIILVSRASPSYAEKAREGLGTRAHPVCIRPGILRRQSDRRSLGTTLQEWELCWVCPAHAGVTYVHLPSRPTALIWFAVTKYTPRDASYIPKICARCARFPRPSLTFSVWEGLVHETTIIPRIERSRGRVISRSHAINVTL